MKAIPLLIQILLSPLIVYMAYNHATFPTALGIYIAGFIYGLSNGKHRSSLRYFSLLVGSGIIFMVFAIYFSKAYVEAMRIPMKNDVMAWFFLYYAGVFIFMTFSVYKWLLGPYKDEYLVVVDYPRPSASSSLEEQFGFYLTLISEFKRVHADWLVKSFIKYVGIGAVALLLLLYADSKASYGYGIEYVFSRGDYLAKIILQILPLLAFMFLGMFRWEQFNLMTLLAPFTVWIGVWELRGVSEIGNHMFIIGLFLLLFALGYYTGEMVFIKFLRRRFSRTPAMATNAGSVPINPTSPDMVVSENGSNIQTEMPPTITGSLEEVLSNMDSLLKAYKQAYSKKKVENPYAELRTGNEVLDRILDRFRKPRIAMYEKKFLDDVINEFAGFDVL